MPQFKTKVEEYALLGGINTKASEYVTGAQEFLDLTNLNFAKSGALTKRDGSTFYLGATVIGSISGLTEYEKLNGSSFVIATSNTNMYSVTSSFNAVKTGLKNNALCDFQTFVDRLFVANGENFFKYDGTNSSLYSLPPGTGLGVTTAVGGSLAGGTYFISYGYYNDRGYFGPTGNTQIVSISGSTFLSIQYLNVTFPISDYGASGIAFYRSQPGGVNLFRTFTTGATTSAIDIGATALTSNPSPTYLHFTLAPRFISIFNNSLMMAGFSSMLSTLWFSDVGEPEGVKPESFFEVRTNDGDKITAVMPYNGNCLIFKERSFSRLSGDNKNNYSLTEITDQYGCLSNRAVVVWNDLCWFLDRKGVMQFNGANIDCMSSKIEPIFLRMNIDAAKDKATAIHDRLNNQVKFSFPIDGADYNNITAVYDYFANSWTTETGYRPAVSAMIRGRLDKPYHFYGGYSGTIHNFSSGVLGDNGNGMTCLVKTRFMAVGGNSVEKQFRRLFLDVVPVGSSSVVNVNIYQDHGASIVLNRSMYQAPFQSRIDFGIMAKSISAELSHYSNSEDMQINGFTIESREQRRV